MCGNCGNAIWISRYLKLEISTVVVTGNKVFRSLNKNSSRSSGKLRRNSSVKQEPFKRYRPRGFLATSMRYANLAQKRQPFNSRSIVSSYVRRNWRPSSERKRARVFGWEKIVWHKVQMLFLRQIFFLSFLWSNEDSTFRNMNAGWKCKHSHEADAKSLVADDIRFFCNSNVVRKSRKIWHAEWSNSNIIYVYAFWRRSRVAARLLPNRSLTYSTAFFEKVLYFNQSSVR